MNLNQARSILGEEGMRSSNEELKKDIEIAELLKDIFFDLKLDISLRNKIITNESSEL